VVEAVGSFYQSQAPTFLESAGPRKLLQYDAVLGNGLTIHGTVVIEHNPDGSVPRVSVTFSPLGAALSLAGRLGALLDKDLGEACSSEAPQSWPYRSLTLVKGALKFPVD
jgi:hypothetical protein